MWPNVIMKQDELSFSLAGIRMFSVQNVTKTNQLLLMTFSSDCFARAELFRTYYDLLIPPYRQENFLAVNIRFCVSR